MPATIGNFAVAGASFFITGQDGFTYRYDGTAEGGVVAASIPGSIWVDHTNNKFYYIDSNKYKRSIPLISIGTKAGAILGSVWIQSKYWNWIGSNSMAYQGHSDHTDGGYTDGGYSNYSDYRPGYNDHGDSRPHSDKTVYTDSPPHHDGPYADGGYAHSNYQNQAAYSDSGYSDSGYSDSGYYDSGYSDYADHADTPVRV